MSDVILYNRKPAIQLSATDFKYLTEAELVAIIQAKNVIIAENAVSIGKYISEIAELKSKIENSIQKKGKKNGDSNDVPTA
jgi:hypothetical protein